MARLLHTSDWRIGAIPIDCPHGVAARMRDRRIDAIRHVATAAAAHDVDAVVVTGNTLADLTLGEGTIQSFVKAMEAFDRPVIIVPGETDPAAPFGAWHRVSHLRPSDAVWCVADGSPITVGDVTLLPVPRTRKASVEDRTRDLDLGAHTNPVVLTHGGCRGGPHADEAAHRIDAAALLDNGATAVLLGGRAVGDTHDAVAWPGSPQPLAPDVPTGVALLVDTDGTVTSVELPHVHWSRRRLDVHDVLEQLQEIGEPQDHILQLTLEGRCTPEVLHRLLHELRTRAPVFMHLEWTTDEVFLDGSSGLPTALGKTQQTLLNDGSPASRRATMLLAELMEET